MIQEPAVELTIHQEFEICRLAELYSANAAQAGPRARMVVARLESLPTSFQSQRKAGHILLHQLVSTTLPDRPLNLTVSHTATGSPQLLLNGVLSRYAVSIAHSRQWLAAGLAENCTIGVDIEKDAPRKNAQALAEWLAWEDKESSADHFIRQWVLWEASAKCAQQSILKKTNPGFAALDATLSPVCFGTSGAWTGWRDQIDNEVQFALALFADSAAPLQHRTLNPKRHDSWPTSDAF